MFSSEIGRLVGKTFFIHFEGYSVRFEDVTSKETKIKYATDGMIIREAQLDPLLKQFPFSILTQPDMSTLF
jgi:HrpA-like RNA helicase